MGTSKKRNYNIDLLRIFSCIMIIALHETGFVYPYYFKWTCLQSVIRPCLWVFCAISGYYLLNSKDDIKSFYKKRLKKILIPFVIYSFFLLFANNIINHQPIFTNLNKSFLFNLYRGENSGHLWFIYSLLGIYLIIPFLKKMVEHLTNNQLLVLLFIMYFFIGINPEIESFGLSTKIVMPLNSVMLFYFILGYYISKLKVNKKGFIILSVFEVINILSIVLFLRNANFIKATLYTSSFNMIFGVVYYFIFFDKLKIPKKLNNIIDFISNRTYAIYIIHLFILYRVSHYVNKPYTQGNIIYLVPIKVFLIFIVSLIITSIIYLTDKILKKVIDNIFIPVFDKLHERRVFIHSVEESFVNVFNEPMEELLTVNVENTIDSFDESIESVE